MKFIATIKGTAPILHHKFSEEDLTSPKKPRSGDKILSEKEKREKATKFLYTDKKGRVCQPSSHIEGTMSKAATQFKMSGNNKKTYKDLVKGGVFVFPEYIPHKNQKWIVDSRAIVNPNTKGRSMCYRPRINNWELEFELEVNDDRADEHVIKNILEYAGAYTGISAYRPRFGRFEVTKFKRTE